MNNNAEINDKIHPNQAKELTNRELESVTGGAGASNARISSTCKSCGKTVWSYASAPSSIPLNTVYYFSCTCGRKWNETHLGW